MGGDALGKERGECGSVACLNPGECNTSCWRIFIDVSCQETWGQYDGVCWV